MTQEEKKQWADAFKARDEYKRKRALRALFEKDSISCEMMDYNIAIRSFLWLKTFICLLLNRTGGTYLDYGKGCVLSYDESFGYEGSSWDACWCSPFVFKDWNVCLASDGT